MEHLQELFAENMPEIITEIIRPQQSWVDDPDMRSKVVQNGDAAILGVGL